MKYPVLGDMIFGPFKGGPLTFSPTYIMCFRTVRMYTFGPVRTFKADQKWSFQRFTG